MTIVRRIAPVSAFKVGFMVNAILGVIGGVLCSTMAFAAIAPAWHPRMPFMHGAGALLPVVLCPLLYGFIGGITAVIGALIYNVASRWVGGLQVDIG